MPPGCRLWRRIRFFLVFLVVFSLGLLDMCGGDAAKAGCDGLGELEIVFDAVVWEKVASVLVFA